MAIRIPHDTVQWGFFLIPNFMDGRGAIIVKGHHSFADGVGLGQFFMAIQDNYDPKSRPGIKHIPWFKMALIYLISPFLVLKSQINFFLSPRLTNSINNDKPTSGRKQGAFTCDLDLKKIKKLCKQLGCTHNDMMTTLMSNTFYEHFKNNGEKYDSINAGIPFSLKKPSEKIKEIRMENDMVGLSVNIKLF